MVTSAPYGSSRSRFFVSYGLHGLPNFITHLPGKYACHEIRNLPVAGVGGGGGEDLGGWRELIRGRKKFCGVIGRPFMQGFSSQGS